MQQGRLPRPVRARDGNPLTRYEVERDRPEPEAPALDDRVVEPCHEITGAISRVEGEPELPGLEGLLGQLVPLEQALSLAHLRPERVCSAPVRATGGFPERVAAGAGLRPPRRDELRELTASLDRVLVAFPLRDGLRGSPGRVLVPGARPLRQSPGARIDLEHARHRLLEQGPIVADDDEAAVVAREEALQPLEAVQVEVVRRLVEEQEVEAG